MARINGTARADTLNGTDAADEIDGKAGNDVLSGNGGNDDIDGDRGNDVVNGGAGSDDLDGGAGHDTLSGDADNDDLDGEGGRDVLSGGEGNDTLDGGRGDDQLTGGAGVDVFSFDRRDGADTIADFENGVDRLDFDDLGAAGIRALIDGARAEGGNVILTLASGATVTIQNMQLSQLDLSDFSGSGRLATASAVAGIDIDGTEGNDVLSGGAGNDDIDGRGGDDRLRGAGGNDELDGDAGNDILRGGAGNDDLDGDIGNDLLAGGAGSDTLDGGWGNDTLTGGRGADVFEFEQGDGNDRITDFRNGQDRIELDDVTFAQLQALIGAAQQVGSDVVLSLSADTSLTIANLQLSQLDTVDFIL